MWLNSLTDGAVKQKEHVGVYPNPNPIHITDFTFSRLSQQSLSDTEQARHSRNQIFNVSFRFTMSLPLSLSRACSCYFSFSVIFRFSWRLIPLLVTS